MKKKKMCENCGGTDFKNMTTTYPLKCFEKTIMVNRVAVKKCLNCQAMVPTQKGKEKLARCVSAYSGMLGIG